MRLDHIAYRVAPGKRDEAAKFFIDAFGYKQQSEPFEIDFGNNEKALCVALEPPEKLDCSKTPWKIVIPFVWEVPGPLKYHMAPEIFISEGSPGSIVYDWVLAHGGVGGIHHLAYEVDDVTKTMAEWKENGWLEFTSEKPIQCNNGLTQIFSKPNVLGIVIEFINRGSLNAGFCSENVKELMKLSKGD